MAKFCDFGKNVKKKLVDNNQTQEWLIKKVKEDTGLYIDSSYMSRIMTGKNSSPKIISSICKILDIKEEKSPPQGMGQRR